MKSIPHIGTVNGHPTLIVEDTPFIMLAGEVCNSSSSSPRYMEQVWKKADDLGLNTLLLPISWELIEPQEGKFDFSLAQELVNQARRWDKKISFLWFGTWKNAQCYYAPEWVKIDLSRFKRAQVIKNRNYFENESFYGMPYSSLSYLCEETRCADAKAFGQLMAFIREIDSEEHTVLTVQVENETGIMGAAREHSDQADALFASPVSQGFVDYMRTHTETMVREVRQAVESGKSCGSWREVFGNQAEEIFSAYHIASYVNAIAKAGKEEYPLPFTANCWLNKVGEVPGSYPSGGPISKMIEVWRYCAPNIDIISPDIYVPNFMETCDEYTRRGDPLYIPECATHSFAGPRALMCVGRYHAICYSPFGVENMGAPFTDSQLALFGVDVADPALSTPQDVENYGKLNHLLASLMPKLTEKYGTSDLQASCAEIEEMASFTMGSYCIKAKFEGKNGACLILRESENAFYIIAQAVKLRFESANSSLPGMDILSLENGEFTNGIWQRGRRLNGDEAVLNTYQEPTLLHAKLFVYQ